MPAYRRRALLLLSASIAAAAASLAAAHVRTGAIDGYAFASLDGREYYQIARNLIEHRSFSSGAHSPLTPDTWRTPGYPLFLALVMLVTSSDSPAMPILVQQFLTILNILLFDRIARAHLADRRARWAWMLLVAEPYHHFYSLWILPTTLFVSMLLLAWACLAPAAVRSRVRSVVGGVLLGMLVLVWPFGALVPVCVLAAMGVAEVVHRRSSRAGLVGVGITTVAAAVVIFPWLLRNKSVGGHLALSHQGGVVLAYFKATEVVLWQEDRTAERYRETSMDPRQARLPHDTWQEIDRKLRARLGELPADQLEEVRWQNLAQGNKTSLNSFDLSRALRAIGVSMLLERPLATLVCYASRCGTLLVFPLNLYAYPPAGSASYVRHLLIGAVYLVLVLTSAVGLARARPGLIGACFPLACTVALLLAATPQTDPRFRVPVIPMLIFLALLPRGHSVAQNGKPPPIC